MRIRHDLALAVLIITALLTSACQNIERTPSGNDPNAPPGATIRPSEAQPGSSEPLPSGADPYAGVDPGGETIVFWHVYGGSNQEVLQTLVDAFNRTNADGITVVQEYQGSYQDLYTKTLAVTNTPNIPDMIIAFQNQAADLFLRGVLIDMSALVDSEVWGLSEAEREDFFPGVFRQDVYPIFSEARLGFPLIRSAEVLYTNVDWLKELGYQGPPANPEQFREMACAAGQASFSGATEEGTFGFDLNIDASRFASWVFAFGGRIFDEGENIFTLNDPEVVTAMQFLQSLVDEGCAKLADERYSDRVEFGNGTLLFAIGSSSGLSAIEDAVSAGADFNWNISAVPHTTEQPALNVYGASLSILESTPERELAAWLFIEYLASTEVQAVWAAETDTFPVRAGAVDHMSKSLNTHPVYRSGIQQLNNALYEPSVPGYDTIRQEIESAMAAILAGADVQTTLDALNETANAILADHLSQFP